ncbi:MAG: riboflavin synthase [Myxococcales bacterium]|nr:riboflavin synthase [Myxococcales bacterium]
MFTGLVEDVGEIVAVRPEGNGARLTIRTALPLDEVRLGDSIAVDGACLTAEAFEPGAFVVVAGRETLLRTTVGGFRAGRAVHLERAMRVGDRLDGHIVQGHVDGVGRVVSMDLRGESWVLWVALDPALMRFVAEKGSVAIDGVSLTVNEVASERFRVNIVPHTARVTRLAGFRPGQTVNVEVDVLAKYVARLLQADGEPDLLTRLKQNGFR